MSPPPEGIVLGGYRPGALAEVVALHMAYYAPEWGFGRAFETKVAGELAAFLAGADPARDLFLCARDPAGGLVGTITIDCGDAAGEGAHLRWFIVAGHARGRGLGRALMARADAFLADRGHARAHLTTFAGLDPARRLYESFGFRLVAEEAADPWSGTVGLQRFEKGAGAPVRGGVGPGGSGAHAPRQA